MKKTIPEWEEEFKVSVLDPDGFDRKDPNLMKKKFTKEEFLDGLITSTIIAEKDSKLFDEEDIDGFRS